MQTSGFLNLTFSELAEMGKREHHTYINSQPYPHIYFDDFFNSEKLDSVLKEFPQLGDQNDISFNNPNEHKLATQGEYKFNVLTSSLVHFLNSQPFLEFLSHLTGIKGILPDPYFWGGGFHEIKKGGFLKIHADFNKHPQLNLDRRLNVIIYLNKNWEESFGGQFELWNNKMDSCIKKILPVFNRMVIFSTTDYSYHGHPEPLKCPNTMSRKSLALYYYTNGRPASEVTGINRITTDFRIRNRKEGLRMKVYNLMVNLTVNIMPPFILKIYKSINKK